jgi:hypothetical protein
MHDLLADSDNQTSRRRFQNCSAPFLTAPIRRGNPTGSNSRLNWTDTESSRAEHNQSHIIMLRSALGERLGGGLDSSHCVQSR